MDMLKDKIYNLIIATIMRFVLTFNLQKMVFITKKYKLIYCPIRKLLILDYFILFLLHKSQKNKAIKAKLSEKKNPKSLLISCLS